MKIIVIFYVYKITMEKVESKQGCQYESWVSEYFGLPKDFPEQAMRTDFDYGNLINMLAMFDAKRNEFHKQNLSDCMFEQDIKIAKLERLVENAFVAGRSKTSWSQFKKDNDL